MGRFFLYAVAILAGLLFILFTPIVFETDIHFDVNRKKFIFVLYLYGKLKLIGGYAETYQGGIALHISERKAILMPYKEMDAERKRFSFVKTFMPLAFTLTTESGAEYLLPVALAHAILRTYFFVVGGEKERIENNLWLTDGDVLRVSLHSVLFFNVYILLCNLFKFLKGKVSNL